MAGINYDIEKEIKVLSTGTKGWSKEINIISWNNRDAKYDIRDWDPNHEKMGKGVTLSKEEIIALRDALNDLDL